MSHQLCLNHFVSTIFCFNHFLSQPRCLNHFCLNHFRFNHFCLEHFVSLCLNHDSTSVSYSLWLNATDFFSTIVYHCSERQPFCLNHFVSTISSQPWCLHNFGFNHGVSTIFVSTIFASTGLSQSLCVDLPEPVCLIHCGSTLTTFSQPFCRNHFASTTPQPVCLIHCG